VSRPTTYLIHLGRELGTPGSRHGRAGHYLGVALDGNVGRRLRVHQAGAGARILAAANQRGIAYFIARTWPGGRAVERKLKRLKNAPRLCPACVPAPWEFEVQAAEDERAMEDAAELALERELEDRHFGGEVTS
jgi:hypothetical protein